MQALYCSAILSFDLVFLIFTRPFKNEINNRRYIVGKSLIVLSNWIIIILAYDD